MPICLRLLIQEMLRAFSFAIASAGKSIAANNAMIAMTTSSSMSVNAGGNDEGGDVRGVFIARYDFPGHHGYKDKRKGIAFCRITRHYIMQMCNKTGKFLGNLASNSNCGWLQKVVG